jgi:hypothetical protein
MAEEVTEEDAKELVRQFNEARQSVHSFLTKVIQSTDTIKTGNLTSEELGMPNLPVRSIKELELFSRDIFQDAKWADYFRNLAEIHTSSSLSKDALLLKLSVTQKKELADLSPKEQKKNSGWFSKKEDNQTPQQ